MQGLAIRSNEMRLAVPTGAVPLQDVMEYSRANWSAVGRDMKVCQRICAENALNHEPRYAPDETLPYLVNRPVILTNYRRVQSSLRSHRSRTYRLAASIYTKENGYISTNVLYTY